MSEIKRLRMLLELDRLGTVSAVARSLSYSTSAVSQQLAQLERDFGASLIEPSGRRVRLTTQGNVLLARAREVLQAWDAAQSAVTGSLEEVSGSLSIAAFESACMSMIPALVQGLRERHPAAHVTVLQEDADVARRLVLAGRVDLAIVERFPGQTFPQNSEVVETVLFDDRMLMVVPENLDRDVTGPRDAADLDWVMELPDSLPYQWAISLCRRSGFEPRVRYRTSGVLLHQHFARSGLAVGFVPGLTLGHLLTGVRVIDLGPAESRTVYTIARRSKHNTPLMTAVLELLSHRPDAAAG